MPVNFSIKNVPDELAEALRQQARRNHRSLQGELLAVLHASIQPPSPVAPQARERAVAWGVEASAGPPARLNARRGRVVWDGSEAAVIVRQMRDERGFTIKDLFEYLGPLEFETPSESSRWIREARRSR